MSDVLPPEPTPAAVAVTPNQMEALVQRRLLSPEAAASAQMRLAQLDGKLQVPQGGLGAPPKGFQGLFAGGSGSAPSAASPAPATPAPVPKKERDAARAHPASQAFASLAEKVIWADPRKIPAGSSAQLAAAQLPKKVLDLLYEMYPDRVKNGEVPIGWNAVDSYPTPEKAVLAQLLLLGKSQRQPPPEAPPPMIAAPTQPGPYQ